MSTNTARQLAKTLFREAYNGPLHLRWSLSE
jgi:hypothetical protein